MSTSSSLSVEKKHWWLTNRKVSDKYIKEARSLIATQVPSDVTSALSLLDAALVLSPHHETALELRARSLLFLRKFRDVADMLQDYIPSFKPNSDEDTTSTSLSSDASDASGSSSSSSQQLSRERAKLLPSDSDSSNGDGVFRCFSVSDLKRKVLAGLGLSCEKEGQWRYIVLGQACCHLGMMEDAMVLLQTGRRLATAAFRRESFDFHDDNFSNPSFEIATTSTTIATSPPSQPLTELESATNLLNHIKLLVRRRAAAAAALDAGLPAESIRHFSKILDSRRGVPQAFIAGCFVGRAAANKAAGRLAEAIADCNRALAVDPASIPALRARAEVLESVRALPDCLRDLDHLKLLYDAILRDRKLPGPVWRPHHEIRYGDIPGSLRALSLRIQELRQRVSKAEGFSIDYYALLGVRRGCKRSELETAHLLLSLKHKPEKAAAFVDRLEFADEYRDLDTVRDQARMSALILYRMLQKGYSSIMATVMEEEAAEKQRIKAAAAAQAAVPVLEKPKLGKEKTDCVKVSTAPLPETKEKAAVAVAATVFQGVFCRDLAVVGSLLSQVGFGHQTIAVKYEALSC